MKTKFITTTITTVSVLTLSILSAPIASAETASDTNALIYRNRAYVQDIGYGANPVPSLKVADAEIAYVSNAYGPAIYSYPSPVNPVHTLYNAEYVDTAFGPAIYSYPNNNPKHHLNLVVNSVTPDNNCVLPASLTRINERTHWDC